MERTRVEKLVRSVPDIPEDRFTHAVEVLLPILAKLDGPFTYTPAEQLDLKAIASAITKATGKRPAKIHPVSVSKKQPFFGQSDEPVLSPDSIVAAIAKRHLLPHTQSDARLWSVFGELVVGWSTSIKNSVKESVPFMSWAGSCCLGSVFPQVVARELVFDLIYRYLALMAIGEFDRAVKSIEPLIKIMEHAIPVGTAVGEPRTWIVLSA
jgi:hypothetical protein